ncbi:hypothetical protein EGR_09532 [Echinococcus granulosus]|uniref:Uncharacterized protein n=1 Tax=Echinococcus granulosus TaxID=6210 RepID=W6UAU8_ECHGR|nr:hypothetical protein EGR_09532 [Echinococcus granulosus]EUB55592.1 hypothetical protein EGR_09532 [Echinococcus granulosus]
MYKHVHSPITLTTHYFCSIIHFLTNTLLFNLHLLLLLLLLLLSLLRFILMQTHLIISSTSCILLCHLLLSPPLFLPIVVIIISIIIWIIINYPHAKRIRQSDHHSHSSSSSPSFSPSTLPFCTSQCINLALFHIYISHLPPYQEEKLFTVQYFISHDDIYLSYTFVLVPIICFILLTLVRNICNLSLVMPFISFSFYIILVSHQSFFHAYKYLSLILICLYRLLLLSVYDPLLTIQCSFLCSVLSTISSYYLFFTVSLMLHLMSIPLIIINLSLLPSTSLLFAFFYLLLNAYLCFALSGLSRFTSFFYGIIYVSLNSQLANLSTSYYVFFIFHLSIHPSIQMDVSESSIMPRGHYSFPCISSIHLSSIDSSLSIPLKSQYLFKKFE